MPLQTYWDRDGRLQRLCLSMLIGLALVAVSTSATLTSQAPSTNSSEARIARITAGLLPGATVKGAVSTYPSLAAEMSRYNVKGLSIAVADGGQIVWARGFGVKTAGTNEPVTATTLFQAASISKPITATATLRLVDRGTLSLDENVNAYLKSWKVPENEFTTTEKVTLRRIMSHSAGLSVSGFQGYSVTDPLPTVLETLNGQSPANNPAVRVDTVPGAVRRYSGGGIMVQQLLLMDVLGKPFPDLMKELVLTPIGMTHSTFEQQLPAALQSQAASAHVDGSVVPGRYHVYPEMAAAGLWTTPTDLLKWAAEIAAARAGKSNKLLSREIATQMLTLQNDENGLGPALSGTGRDFNFWHAGSNRGFGSHLVYYPETGQGAVIMFNGASRALIVAEILRAIAEEYQWPANRIRQLEPISIDTAGLDRYIGRFVGMGYSADVSREGSRLFVTSASGLKSEAVLVARDKIVILETGIEGTVTFDQTGGIAALEIWGGLLKRHQ
jgi:CubicO group peptidase (beta-lactamase class C family)